MPYRNPPTVVVVLVPVHRAGRPTGLVLVRRGIEPGRGRPALPGGYQVEGETWQEAGRREVLEETGLEVDGLALLDLVTVEEGRINLAFAEARPIDLAPAYAFTAPEVEAVLVVEAPCETAFEAHTRQVLGFFERQGPGPG